MKTKLLFFFILISISKCIFSNDFLIFNDGNYFEGKIIRIKDCLIVFKWDGEKYTIPASEICFIKFEDPSDKVYTNYIALKDDDAERCMKGQMDADMYHGKAFGHLALGVLFGPFAMIGTLASSPSPQSGANTYMLSKNRDLFSDPAYLMCYKKKARSKNTTNAALGWGAWVLFVVIYGSSLE